MKDVIGALVSIVLFFALGWLAWVVLIPKGAQFVGRLRSRVGKNYQVGKDAEK